MHIGKLFESGLTYCGLVESAKQTYYVFKTLDYYLLLTVSTNKPNTGNFTIVSKASVDYVKNLFSGQSVTSKEVVNESANTNHAPTRMDALNLLYVLVALGDADLTISDTKNQLFFNVYQ